jgi:hypothetical protein
MQVMQFDCISHPKYRKDIKTNQLKLKLWSLFKKINSHQRKNYMQQQKMQKATSWIVHYYPKR